MSHALFRFAFGSILLAGSPVAFGQGSSDRAYPMNVEDRINGVTSGGYVALSDDDRPISAAGASPMNTNDRINANRRTLRSGAAASGVTVTTPSLKDRPDAWRYRWHENRWWYYGANNHWLYWTGQRWIGFPNASLVDKVSAAHAQ